MLGSLFRARKTVPTTFAAPRDARIYAVGDIHGRVDLLERMHGMIAEDAEDTGVGRKVLVYLGDYIDRGDSSKDVIDFILDQYLPGFDIVHLSGNHEEIMLAFIEDPAMGPNWVVNGGDATLYSYGVGNPRSGTREERFALMREALIENLPLDHFDFLKSLKIWHVEGDYMFVHAGIRPGRELEDQYRTDVLWIRDEFLSSEDDHGKCIVHGHTIRPRADFRHNRIGIDTGAFSTGRLTCLVLEGIDQRLLQT